MVRLSWEVVPETNKKTNKKWRRGKRKRNESGYSHCLLHQKDCAVCAEIRKPATSEAGEDRHQGRERDAVTSAQGRKCGDLLCSPGLT